MENLIETHGLIKRYGNFVLEDFDLMVPKGCIVGLVGANGAGKTTALKMILGLVESDGGSVELLETPINHEIPDAIKQHIGVVFDTCVFPQEMQVKDIDRLGFAAYKSWDESYFQELIALFDLEPKKKVRELSRGMGMKLMLAFALAHHPRLLILDEATAGLDPLARDAVLDILRNFMSDEDHGILMSTHITSDLEKVADYVVCLENGHIAFEVLKDTICDESGIAHLRTSEVERVLESGLFKPEELRIAKHGYGTDLLVPNRFVFSEAFPELAMDRADIEGYMSLMLKGEHL